MYLKFDLIVGSQYFDEIEISRDTLGKRKKNLCQWFYDFLKFSEFQFNNLFIIEGFLLARGLKFYSTWKQANQDKNTRKVLVLKIGDKSRRRYERNSRRCS